MATKAIAVERPGGDQGHEPQLPKERKTRGAYSFVKWAGGKGAAAREILRRLPREIHGTYFEPFVGSGAAFFALAPARAVLGDANEELMNCYRVLRDRPDALIDALRRHPNTHEHYLALRDTEPESLSEVERAARTIYLNKTCFNGLYRVNSRGRFNVPYGWNARANVCDEWTLRRTHATLAGREIELVTGDYEETLGRVVAGDVVYLDPPYAREKRTSFDKYQAGELDQHRVARVFADLDRRGAILVASNANVPLIHDLYRGFRIEVLTTRRQVARHGGHRTGWTEVLISNARGDALGAESRAPEPRDDEEGALARAIHEILFGYGWIGRTQAFEALWAGFSDAGWAPTEELIALGIRRAAERGLIERGPGGRVRATRSDPSAYGADDWSFCIEMAAGEGPVERDVLVASALDWAGEVLGLRPSHAEARAHAERALSEAMKAALRAGDLVALDLWRVQRRVS